MGRFRRPAASRGRRPRRPTARPGGRALHGPHHSWGRTWCACGQPHGAAPSSSQAPYRSLPPDGESSLIPLLRLSPPNPRLSPLGFGGGPIYSAVVVRRARRPGGPRRAQWSRPTRAHFPTPPPLGEVPPKGAEGAFTGPPSVSPYGSTASLPLLSRFARHFPLTGGIGPHRGSQEAGAHCAPLHDGGQVAPSSGPAGRLPSQGKASAARFRQGAPSRRARHKPPLKREVARPKAVTEGFSPLDRRNPQSPPGGGDSPLFQGA